MCCLYSHGLARRCLCQPMRCCGYSDMHKEPRSAQRYLSRRPFLPFISVRPFGWIISTFLMPFNWIISTRLPARRSCVRGVLLALPLIVWLATVYAQRTAPCLQATPPTHSLPENCHMYACLSFFFLMELVRRDRLLSPVGAAPRAPRIPASRKPKAHAIDVSTWMDYVILSCYIVGLVSVAVHQAIVFFFGSWMCGKWVW